MAYETTSGNGTRGRALKRMKLVFNNVELQFAINPEDYTQTTPNRVTITQTKGGAWLDAWGAGITEITIQGTTGVKGTTNDIDTGYQRWRKLRDMIASVMNSVTDGEEITDDKLIKLYNYTDNEYWYCYPAQGGIELYRSKSRPHMYQYTLHLVAIREIGQPATSVGAIGNPNLYNSGQLTTTSAGSTTTAKGQADEVTYTVGTTTKSKPIAMIQEECRQYCTLIAPVIGGYKGRISPVTGFRCTQGVTIHSSGLVSNVSGFTGADLKEEPDLLTVHAHFENKVAPDTYAMYEKILDYSPDVLSTAYAYIVGNTRRARVIRAVSQSTEYDSTLYSLILEYAPRLILTKSEISMLKMIMLDCMNVYLEMYKIKDQENSIDTTLAITSMNVLVGNIRTLILYFTLKPSPYLKERMDVIHELRKLDFVCTQLGTNVVNYL